MSGSASRSRGLNHKFDRQQSPRALRKQERIRQLKEVCGGQKSSYVRRRR